MTKLTGKQISKSYKQLLKMAVSTNTGITEDICLDNVVFSGTGGNALSIGTINCVTVAY